MEGMAVTDTHLVNPARVHHLNQSPLGNGPVVYWMIRDQRLEANWALLYAAEHAAALKQPLVVVMAFRPDLSKCNGTARMLDFMLAGLQELEASLQPLGVPLVLQVGQPVPEVAKIVDTVSAGLVVTDFNPLRVYQNWHQELADQLRVRCVEVDAHNVVPARFVSPKQEYAARTIRPKIQKQLPDFLGEFPKLPAVPRWDRPWPSVGWKKLRKNISVDESVKKSPLFQPGRAAGLNVLKSFLTDRLPKYDQLRNDPNADVLSNLSPYLHFGQVSAQEVALAVQASSASTTNQEAYLEELIVRRELSDNYCLHQPHYDSFKGFPDWAQKTLNDHRSDPREHQYSFKEFEQAKTHQPLWNAAQQELVKTGKMHGYLRMFWAKKILEWSESPEEAQKNALYLNDKYELDGRDPNGYVGVAWSIGGVHDRPWFERPIYGKVRYMNANGAKRKFDVETYIQRIAKL